MKPLNRKMFVLALLLGMVQGVWAETYSYYIVERIDKTLYFKGTNVAPNQNNHQYLITDTNSGLPSWSLGTGTIWPEITKIVIEPSFAEARPTSTSSWFANKPNLTSIVGMQYLNTSEVTTMSAMFFDCSSLTTLDLSGFNTAKVTEMQVMFKGCTSLTTIIVGDGWTTDNVSNNWNYEMFLNCTSIKGQDGTTYNSSNINKNYAHYGTGGYLTSEANYWSMRVASSFSDINDNSNTITLYNMGEMKLLAQNVNAGNNYSGWTILLVRDMALDPNITNNYIPIGGDTDSNSFGGVFDGQGHTISGVNLSYSGQASERKRLALFATVKKATIRNLTLDNSTFINTSSDSPVAGIVASISNGVEDEATVENCHVTSSVSIQGRYSVGGIVATTLYGTSNIIGCTSAASVATTGDSGVSAGGIIGKCGYEGNSDNRTYVTISNCLYHGTSVSGEGSRIAALVGSYIVNSYSTVTLSNNFYTYPDASVKGIGFKKETNGSNTQTTGPFDLADNHGAVRVHVVTDGADINDMGTEVTSTAGATTNGITLYANGVKYNDTYYSHVLALPDDADLTPLLEQYNGQTFDVKLRGRRLYKDGNWNTLCLPFTCYLTAPLFTNAQEYTIMELDVSRNYYLKDDYEEEDYSKPYKTGVQDGTLYLFFKEAKSISAGTPYIVMWKKVENYNSLDPAYDYQDPVFADVTISNTLQPVFSLADEVTFQPTYEPIVWSYQDRSILFLGTGSTLYYPEGNGVAGIGPCRAYFQLNDGLVVGDSDSGASGGGDVKAFVLNFGDGETGITSTNQPNQADAWYTIDGRRLDKKPAQRGLYINKGKKVVIK